IGRAHVALQSLTNLVCRLLLEKKKTNPKFVTISGIGTLASAPERSLPLAGMSCSVKSIGSMSSAQLFFFNDTGTPEIYTLSLPDPLPIPHGPAAGRHPVRAPAGSGVPARTA